MDEGSPLSYAIIAFLLFMAAWFAVSETSFASVSRMKIKTRVERGDRRAEKAAYVLDNFDRAITTILIGTNIVHIATASIVTVLVTRRWGVSAVTVSTIVTTMVVFFVGEMLPKSIAKKYSERFALATAGSLCFFMRIFKPLACLLSWMGNQVAKRTKGDAEVTVTEDELYDIIENMKDEGELDSEKGELVHSALMFADVPVESVVTARVDVAAVDIDDSPEEILAFIKEQRHSRLPVYRDSIDNIIGILQIRKYIKAYMKQGPGLEIEPLLDEAWFVHQSATIDEVLPEMSRRKLNMAVVTDNYGGTLGIVTVEDIVEELVGEIWDEDDVVREPFVRNADGSVTASASADMEDVFEFMGYDDPEDNDWGHQLLGEWVYQQSELLPRTGDEFEYHRLVVKVAEMNNHRITKLDLSLKPQETEEGGEDK